MSNTGTVRTHTVSKTLSIPLRFIGAQELMSTAPITSSGFLAKRGRRERLVERFNLPNKPMFNDIKKWRRRFVVVSQGCVYIYDKETSTRPHQSFALYGYNRLSVMGSDHGAFTFRIEGKYGSGFKMFHFSTATSDERKEWMSKLREEMCVANDKESASSYPDISTLTDDEAFTFLQQPVIEDETEDDGNSSDSSDYDKIEDEVIQKEREKDQEKKNRKRALPSVPEEPKSNTMSPSSRDIRNSPKPRRASADGGRRAIPHIPENGDAISGGSVPKKAVQPPKKKREPKPSSKPNSEEPYVNKKVALQEKDYMYNSADRDEVKKILDKGPDGTFLVRNSRSDDSKVLAVKSDNEVREYKIFVQNTKVTLDRKEYYNSMQDLLKHYKRANLPKRDTALGKAYSSFNLSNI